jgi:hypothetical protein
MLRRAGEAVKAVFGLADSVTELKTKKRFIVYQSRRRSLTRPGCRFGSSITGRAGNNMTGRRVEP